MGEFRSYHFLTWGQLLGKKECPYARRWILDFKLFTLRVHHFYRSDDDRNYHDHPWWFLTFILKGSYTDESEKGHEVLRAGSFAFRRAEHRHTVRTTGVWTLLVTGPEKRTWGFWVKNKIGGMKFLRARRYFWKYGHHPCDQP